MVLWKEGSFICKGLETAGFVVVTKTELKFIFSQTNRLETSRSYKLFLIRELKRLAYCGSFNAFEIMFSDGASFIFKFDCEESQKQVSTKLVRMSIYQFISGKTQIPNLEYLQTLNPINLLAIKDLTKKWCENRISSMDYLSSLNSIAGRTFNDNLKHPIFPNVLKSYSGVKPEFIEFGSLKHNQSLFSGKILINKMKVPMGKYLSPHSAYKESSLITPQ